MRFLKMTHVFLLLLLITTLKQQQQQKVPQKQLQKRQEQPQQQQEQQQRQQEQPQQQKERQQHGDENLPVLNHGKTFHMDFSEPIGSRSRSNGQNQSAIDDIVRLNNITVAMFEQPDSKFDFLLKRNSSKRLKNAHEGDMTMDEIDRIAIHTFIKAWGESEPPFETEYDDPDTDSFQAQQGDQGHDNDSNQMKKKKEKEVGDSFESDVETVIQQSSGSSQSVNPSDGLITETKKKGGKKKFKPTDSLSSSGGGIGTTQSSSSSSSSTHNPPSGIKNLQGINQPKPTPVVVEMTEPPEGARSRDTGTYTSTDFDEETMIPESSNLIFTQHNSLQRHSVKSSKVFGKRRQYVDNTITSSSVAEDATKSRSAAPNQVAASEIEKVKKSVIVFGRKMWVSNIVPFIITHEGSQRWPPGHLYMKIRKIMDYFESATCIKFREKKQSDKQYLKIFRGIGCYAEIGRQFWKEGPTLMSLGEWCVQEHIISHLLMHVLGFLHESTRPDRNSFIKYYPDRVTKKYKAYWNRHFSYDFSIQNVEYDYRSIMHYGNKAFASNPNDITVESKLDKNEPLGGKIMTKYDIGKIHKMYHCDAANGTIPVKPGLSPWSAWSVDCLNLTNKGCNKIRQRVCIGEDMSLCEGVDKYGVEDELWKCDPKECEEEYLVPHWSEWEPPGPCSKTCDRGIEVSKRKCNNPPPTRTEGCAGSHRRTAICRIKKCNPDPFDTDFESSWGVWTQNFQFPTTWIRHQGPSKFRRTGPTGDHTSGKGYYALLTTHDRVKGVDKIGEIISDPINTKDRHKCIVFYFLMNGIGVNYLKFYLRVNNVYFQIWNRQGHQGNMWLKGAISLPKSNVEYYLIADGKTGMYANSDIAIDDFTIGDGFCPKGVEGCYDFFQECEEWRDQGLCVSQFKYLIFSCCKTCENLNFEGLELDLEW